MRECRSAGITIDNLAARCAALAEDHQRAIESIKQADSAVKLAHEKFSALAAENAGLKVVCEDRRTFIMNGVQLGYIQVPTVETDPALETIRVAVSPQEPTPATDAFLAEVRAKAFDDLCAAFVKDARVAGLDDGDIVTVKDATDALLHCADQLRKGVHS
ncbi:hypothetical protein ACRTPM_001006 [Escherichia coli]|nr:hypothetical protein [Escherichia coli]